MTAELRTRLAEERSESDWRGLREHAGRGALFVVSSGLNLLDVTAAVASDDTAVVEGWLQAGELSRPSEDELKCWEKEPSKRFEFLIAQPYVLARPL